MYPSSFPEPTRASNTWTLATYNVQDLFDAVDDPKAADERPTENQLRNKLTRLGRMLQVLDADIVGLMEVETLGVLQRLNTEALGALGYSQVILREGNDPERGIDVALLSRLPVVQVVSHADEVWPEGGGPARRLFSRDCLECHVTLPSGETLVVLVNHFKSKRGGGDEGNALRTAQAVRVREIADGLLATHPLTAIVGDLNDTADSPALVSLLRDKTWADLIAQDVPEASRYSFLYMGQPERIDYVLASPALRQQFVPNSALIPHDLWARRASDHSPLRVTFGDAPGYAESLTALYDRDHPPHLPRRAPARIDAARFWWRDAYALEGQTVLVTGRVLHAEETRGVGTVRLLLGSADPLRALRVTILAEDLAAWARAGTVDPAGYYKNRVVRAVGEMGFFGNVPEMIVRRPDQLRILR